jgi:hypothetical protein
LIVKYNFTLIILFFFEGTGSNLALQGTMMTVFGSEGEVSFMTWLQFGFLISILNLLILWCILTAAYLTDSFSSSAVWVNEREIKKSFGAIRARLKTMIPSKFYRKRVDSDHGSGIDNKDDFDADSIDKSQYSTELATSKGTKDSYKYEFYGHGASPVSMSDSSSYNMKFVGNHNNYSAGAIFSPLTDQDCDDVAKYPSVDSTNDELSDVDVSSKIVKMQSWDEADLQVLD